MCSQHGLHKESKLVPTANTPPTLVSHVTADAPIARLKNSTRERREKKETKKQRKKETQKNRKTKKNTKKKERREKKKKKKNVALRTRTATVQPGRAPVGIAPCVK